MSDLTVDEFNKLIDVNYENGIVYISGIINKPLSPWSSNLHGYLIGTIPSTLKPERRLIFMKFTDRPIRIDITKEGHIVVMAESGDNINYVNLFGIQYSILTGYVLQLLNGWEWWNQPYRYPSFSKHGSIVYLSGIIKGGLPNKPFGQLPAFYCPPIRLTFQAVNGYPNGETARIDILPNGECVISALNQIENCSGLLGWYSLDGIYFDISPETYMKLPINTSWKNTIQHYNQDPRININGQSIHLSGQLSLMSQLKKNQSSKQIIASLPKHLAPNKELICHKLAKKYKNNNEVYTINIYPNGIISATGKINHINLDGLSYFKDLSKNMINKPMIQTGGSIQSNIMGSLSGFDQYNVDGAQNFQLVDLNMAITVEGLITNWQADIGRVGETYLQIYRPVTVDTKTGNGTYKLVGEFRYSFKQLGVNNVTLSPDFQLSVKVGDYIGWRYPNLGTIKYRNNSGLVKWLFGNSPGVDQLISFTVGEARTYAYTVTIQPTLTQIVPLLSNQKEIGGNPNNPATSAQHIVDEYKKKGLSYPLNGPYWIRVYDYLDPKQIYCNFSYRKGYGYMLIASITDKINWLPMNNNNIQLNPYISYGDYQSNGQMANYYRQWDDLDINTILDKDPVKCQSIGNKYVSGGKFCGTSDDNRLNLDGGISEFMFATGNGQYWIILPRNEIPGFTTKQIWKSIKLVDSSKNFEGGCDANNTGYLITRPGVSEDPWINAGNQHACAPNYMFWGMNNYPNHTTFKNKNGGIQLFIGGRARTDIDKNVVFPYNPGYYELSYKPPASATYDDAVALCATKGQKVCSKDELAEANAAGYSSCSPGWTDTVEGLDSKNWVGYPTSMNEWIKLNTNTLNTDQKCGNPGLNQVSLLSRYSGTSNIYCCDKFNFSSNFDKLDEKYLLAKLWIYNVENLFKKTYGQDIPYPIDYLVYNEEGWGVSVSKKGQSYELINNEKGKAPQKLSNIRCQLPQLQPFGSNRSIIFLNDIEMFKIVKGALWPLDTGNLLAVTFGSQIRLTNLLNGSNLTTQEINYYNPGSGQKTQVMATNNEDKSALWLIKTQRGLGPLDNQGYGDEKYLFGQPIKNGDIVRLESVLSGKNLHTTTLYKAPSGRQEVYVNAKGKFGDSNDHWRVEIPDGLGWITDSQFKLIHVNTNTVLFSDSLTYKPKPDSDLRYLEVVANVYQGPGDTWKLTNYIIGQPVNDKCSNLAMDITRINLQIKSINEPTQIEKLKQNKLTLIEQYTNECWRLSVADYKKKMGDEESEIKKITSTMDMENQRLLTINNQIKQELDQKYKTNKKYDDNNLEYQKLINREHCKPVTSCVPEVGNNQNIPPQCQSIMNEISDNHGIITSDISDRLKNILVNQDNIAQYDIRNHKDFYKLIENSKIVQCPPVKKS